MATEIDTFFVPAADWANVIEVASVSGTAPPGPSVAGEYYTIVGIKGDSTVTIAAPDAFTAGQWSVAGGSNSGELTFIISTLPNRNGRPITKFQYSLNSGSNWSDLPAGIVTGSYTVTGLVASTTYTNSLMIRAVNSIGDGGNSDAKTATVTGSTWPDSNITSDNFASGSLGAHWTSTEGGVTGGWSFGNDGSNYWAQHQFDTANHTGNSSARIMQVPNNDDFQISTVLTALVSSPGYHGAGIYIEQDGNDRIEVQLGVHSNGTRWVEVENIVNGVNTGGIAEQTGISAVGVRATRIDNNWTFDYTTDGTNWVEYGSFSRTMTVAKVGPMHFAAGPDNTICRFDFFETADAPISSGEDS